MVDFDPPVWRDMPVPGPATSVGSCWLSLIRLEIWLEILSTQLVGI